MNTCTDGVCAIQQGYKPMRASELLSMVVASQPVYTRAVNRVMALLGRI